MKSFARFGINGVFILCLAQPPLFAAGIVTNPDESSLRAAMVGGGTVTFDCDGTIMLTNTIAVTNSVVLDSASHSITISGGNAIRLFHVFPGITLTLKNLTLADGAVVGTNGNPGVAGGVGDGGAIYNEGGTIQATGCGFIRNHARGGTGGDASEGPASTLGAGGPAKGGVIFNLDGQVSITNCTFTQNGALGGVPGMGNSIAVFAMGGDAAGGVLYNTAGGSVHIVNSMIANNAVVSGQGRRAGLPSSSGIASGGIIYNAGGDVILITTLIVSNSCTAELASVANGGALYQSAGALTISGCTLGANHVHGGRGITGGGSVFRQGGDARGGAICSIAGTVAVTNSTFVGNIAEGGYNGFGLPSGSGIGGAMFNSATLSLHNTTLAQNSALGGKSLYTPGSGYGGGLYNNGGMASLAYVTIAENLAKRSIGSDPIVFGVSEGGGIWNSGASVVLLGTILSSNTSGSNCFGAVIDWGYNLSSDSSCNFTNIGSLNSTDAKLGPLDNYGGPTPTMALLSGSPAIDGGNPGNFPPADQRGRVRPYGAAPDIGAFESSEPFVIRGRLRGVTFAEETLVQAGDLNVTTTNHGSYSLEGLTVGSYAVTPSTATYLAVPTSRVVTVGPDHVNVDFKAYRWNALSLESASNGVLHLAFAGTDGQTYRVLSSSNLVDWLPVSTNTTGTSNLFEFFDPTIQSNQLRFYRTVSP
ncbi:MAG TPA: choice-of-anchor Q domain-containing protein [Verrucomicrobiae bacterium]|nr:choice-of-anchor Q domain-containing protein [Verrucomicrobiae bacterium]